MTLNEIIRIASSGYPDDHLVMFYWNFKRSCPKKSKLAGDTLALFLANELFETYDDGLSDAEQLEAAARCVRNACRDLVSVHRALLCRTA
jgi:hypothetical protein